MNIQTQQAWNQIIRQRSQFKVKPLAGRSVEEVMPEVERQMTPYAVFVQKDQNGVIVYAIE